MISKGYKYSAFNPKILDTKKGKKFLFQIGDKGRDGEYRYASFMTECEDGFEDIQHKEKLTIEDITAVTLSEYNGKYQTTIFGKIKRLVNNELELDQEVVIDEADLPF